MKRLARDERGVALPPAAFGILMVLGITGMAVEAGHIYLTDASLQSAADAAAIAGARALPHADAVHGAVYRTTEQSLPSGSHGTALSDGDVVLGRLDLETHLFTQGNGPANAVRVTVRRSMAGGNPVPTVFSRLFGVSGVDLVAESVAAKIRDPICLLALEPAGRAAVTVGSDAAIAAANCTVQINSSSAGAIALDPGATVTAETICTQRGDSGHGFQPTPDRCPPAADPLAGMLSPPVAGAPCDFGDTLIGAGTHQLSPGVYCGRLEIGGGAMVTFLPGIYAIRDGAFVIEGGADVAGAGVAFHLAGSKSVLWFKRDAIVRFSAPTVGPLAGMLFFQDRADGTGTAHRIAGTSQSHFEGVVYLPNGVLRLDSQGPINSGADFSVFIARVFEIGPGSTLVLNSDYAASSVPLPDGLGRLIALAR